MAVVNGTYTPTALAAIQMKMNEMLKTDLSVNRMYKYFNPATVKAMMAAQAAKIKFSETEERSFSLAWFEKVNSAIVAGDMTDCAFTGTSGGTDARTYTLDNAFHDKFMVNNKVERTNLITEEEEIAQNLLQSFYKLAVQANTLAIALLEANKGTAVVTGTGLTSDADGVDVPAASYNNLLMSKIKRIEILNKIQGSLVVTGGRMYDEYFNATSRMSTDDKNDEARRLAILDWIFDLEGLGADTDEPIYMASPFCYALVNKARDIFPLGKPRLAKTGDKEFFRLENPFVPGLWHEVTVRFACLDGVYDTSYFSVNTWLKGFMNPNSINTPLNTGIVKLLRVA